MKMKKEHIISGVVILGVIVCAAVWYVTVVYPENNAQVLRTLDHEQHTTGVYGTVVAVSPTSITLEVLRHDGENNFTFVLDDRTVFVKLSNDDVSTEIPFDKSTIAVGDDLTVLAEEVVGSVENQHAIKVVHN